MLTLFAKTKIQNSFRHCLLQKHHKTNFLLKEKSSLNANFTKPCDLCEKQMSNFKDMTRHAVFPHIFAKIYYL